MRRIGKGKIHYAWAICLSCALLLFVSMGLCANVFSVYHPRIISDYGFTNTQASLITTCRNLTSLLCVAVVDSVNDRFGLKRTVAIGLGFEVLSRLIFTVTTSFPLYCLAAVCGGITYAWAGMVPLAILIGNWFQDRHGLAIGLSAAGSSIATIVMPPILTEIISEYGLAKAFLTEAVMTAIISVAILALIIETPAQKGLTPFSEKCIDKEAKNLLPEKEYMESVGIGRWQRVAMLVVMVMLGGPAGPAFNHLSVLFTTEGYSYDEISWLIPLLGIGMLFGKILVGLLYDKVGSWCANYLVCGALATAMLLCAIAPGKSIVITLLIMAMLGLGLPSISVSTAIWDRDIEGDRESRHAMKVYTTGYSFGAMISSPIPGLFADFTGRYVGAYAVFAAMTLVATVLLQGVYCAKLKGTTGNRCH